MSDLWEQRHMSEVKGQGQRSKVEVNTVKACMYHVKGTGLIQWQVWDGDMSFGEVVGFEHKYKKQGSN